MKTMKFARNFSKISESKFTTIRRKNLYTLGELYKIVTPEGYSYAIITKIEEYPSLEAIPENILIEDTGEPTAKEAMALIRSFYSKMKSESPSWWLLTLEKKELHEYHEIRTINPGHDQVVYIICKNQKLNYYIRGENFARCLLCEGEFR